MKMYTISKLCEITGLAYATIYKSIKSGELPAALIKGIYYISQDDYDTFILVKKAEALGADPKEFSKAIRKAKDMEIEKQNKRRELIDKKLMSMLEEVVTSGYKDNINSIATNTNNSDKTMSSIVTDKSDGREGENL